jgi:hypothetical protein
MRTFLPRTFKILPALAYNLNNADGETRTLTPKILEPKSSASTNSATSADISNLPQCLADCPVFFTRVANRNILAG